MLFSNTANLTFQSQRQLASLVDNVQGILNQFPDRSDLVSGRCLVMTVCHRSPYPQSGSLNCDPDYLSDGRDVYDSL